MTSSRGLVSLAIALVLWTPSIAHGCDGPAFTDDGSFATAQARFAMATDQAVLAVPALASGTGFTYDAPTYLVATNTADDVLRAADDVAEYGSTPAGRPYTRHYGTETGPQRNIPGSVVDEAIDIYPGKLIDGGKTVHYDPVNDITVVTGNGQSIVSVHRGLPRAGQR